MQITRKDFNKPTNPESRLSEDRLMQELHKEFMRKYGTTAVIHHSPNETMNEVERRKNSQKGTRSGFSDIIILKGKKYLLIELKVNTGTLTDAEINLLNQVIEMNGNCAVCWNSEQFWEVTDKFMNDEQ